MNPARGADDDGSSAAPRGPTKAASPRALLPRVIVYSDGASRGNPGPAGAGWVICDGDERVIATGNLFLGRRTNNEAEYLAAAMGLQAASQFGRNEVVLRADSELMVRQLMGVYRVKNPRLLPLFEAVQQARRAFRSFGAQHVPRHLNAAADAQANLAIDEAQGR